jgi:two-component system, cell cycle sensor histidine kinase and response regulator CckA
MSFLAPSTPPTDPALPGRPTATDRDALASIAHDFNNLLVTILGTTDLLLLDPAATPDQRRRMEAIRRGTERGMHLARRLQEDARAAVEAGPRTSMNEVVLEVLALAEGMPGAVRLRACLDPRVPAVAVNATELHRVVLNLVVNARDAMPRGGELFVRTRRMPAPAGEDGTPGALLEVCDTGVGIAEDIKDRVFERFFTTKAEGTGTGLGLAVVRGIVTAHGGRVTFESREGQGSVFRVLLPGVG